jgi:hypothetical protein
MITPEIFNRNEALRQRLAQAIDILELAFTAADTAEDERQADVKGDAIAFAMAHAERRAITRFKNAIRTMARVPKEEIGPLEASYNSVDPFTQIGLDAEREHNESQSKPKTPKVRNKP